MLDMYERKMCVSNQPTGIKPQLNVWQHLVITHNSGRFKTPGLTIYINGKQLYKSPMACVTLAEPFIGIGTGGPFERMSVQKDHTGFNGKMGPIYLLNKVLTPEQVVAFYQLGQNYMFTFQDSSKEVRQLIIQPPSCLFDGSLSNSIVFTFNAFTFKDNFLVNNAPSEIFSQIFGNAKNYKLLEGVYCQILPGSRCCATRTVLYNLLYIIQ